MKEFFATILTIPTALVVLFVFLGTITGRNFWSELGIPRNPLGGFDIIQFSRLRAAPESTGIRNAGKANFASCPAFSLSKVKRCAGKRHGKSQDYVKIRAYT